MADPQQPASGASADLESKEIWGDEADQLDEEIMKVQQASRLQQCFALRGWSWECGCCSSEDCVGNDRDFLRFLILDSGCVYTLDGYDLYLGCAAFLFQIKSYRLCSCITRSRK